MYVHDVVSGSGACLGTPIHRLKIYFGPRNENGNENTSYVLIDLYHLGYLIPFYEIFLMATCNY